MLASIVVYRIYSLTNLSRKRQKMELQLIWVMLLSTIYNHTMGYTIHVYNSQRHVHFTVTLVKLYMLYMNTNCYRSYHILHFETNMAQLDLIAFDLLILGKIRSRMLQRPRNKIPHLIPQVLHLEIQVLLLVSAVLYNIH